MNQRGKITGIEWCNPGDHFVKDAPEGVKIRALVDTAIHAHADFGRHVPEALVVPFELAGIAAAPRHRVDMSDTPIGRDPDA
nr:hypothetical protein [Paraburkholderia sp. MMS20-SJTN17]